MVRFLLQVTQLSSMIALSELTVSSMANKVKVSMFLDPAVAHAVKVQAARQGAGVSELVGNFFLCAHCREPITDDFAVGTPKLIGMNKYGVFFHRNREACAAASGTRFGFLKPCPSCKVVTHQSFDRKELVELLKAKTVRFYCIQCDNHWNATATDLKQIEKEL
jgi:hypothetical protein